MGSVNQGALVGKTSKQIRHTLLQLPCIIGQFLFGDAAHDQLFILLVEIVSLYCMLRSPESTVGDLKKIDISWMRLCYFLAL